MVKSLKHAPKLDSIGPRSLIGNDNDKISIIIPARNEEKYIAKCLDSLLKQDYPSFEIIVINDSSEDGTWNVIEKYAHNYKESIMAVNADPKPEGWAGKSWACYQGFLKATGNILMFTDADTIHSQYVLLLAIKYLTEQKLDVLTLIPRLVCEDIWTRIALPLIWTISYVRYSPLRANDPKNKTGYLFGSFFMINRKVYEAVGTHKRVKNEIVEDGALGGILKKSQFRLNVVRGERFVDARWAQDFNTLWHGLRRLMIPLYHQDKAEAYSITIATFFLLLLPFVLLPFSAVLFSLHDYYNNNRKDLLPWSQLLFYFDSMIIALVFLSSVVQLKNILFYSSFYSLGSWLASIVISLAFISSIIDARKKETVMWKGRTYTISQSKLS